jgi:hypothetical protein
MFLKFLCGFVRLDMCKITSFPLNSAPFAGTIDAESLEEL